VRGDGLDALDVVRVDALTPPTEVVHDFIAAVAEDRLEVLVPLQRVALEISLPNSLERDTSQQPIPPFAE
jgi:hypothetical protein